MIIFSKKIEKTTEIEFIKSCLSINSQGCVRYLPWFQDTGLMNAGTVAPLIHSRRDGNFLTAEEIARRKAKYAVVRANAVTPAVLTRIIQKPIGISAKFVPLTVELRSASIE